MSTDVLGSLSLVLTHVVQAACKHSSNFGLSPRVNTLLQKMHFDKNARISLSWLSVVHSIRWSLHSSSTQTASCIWDCVFCLEVFCSEGSSFTVTGDADNADIPAIDSGTSIVRIKFDDVAFSLFYKMI